MEKAQQVKYNHQRYAAAKDFWQAKAQQEVHGIATEASDWVRHEIDITTTRLVQESAGQTMKLTTLLLAKWQQVLAWHSHGAQSRGWVAPLAQQPYAESTWLPFSGAIQGDTLAQEAFAITKQELKQVVTHQDYPISWINLSAAWGRWAFTCTPVMLAPENLPAVDLLLHVAVKEGVVTLHLQAREDWLEPMLLEELGQEVVTLANAAEGVEVADALGRTARDEAFYRWQKDVLSTETLEGLWLPEKEEQTWEHTISEALQSRIGAGGKECGVNPVASYWAAWSMALYISSRQSEFLLGIPTQNASGLDVQPCRITVSPEMALPQLWHQLNLPLQAEVQHLTGLDLALFAGQAPENLLNGMSTWLCQGEWTQAMVATLRFTVLTDESGVKVKAHSTQAWAHGTALDQVGRLFLEILQAWEQPNQTLKNYTYVSAEEQAMQVEAYNQVSEPAEYPSLVTLWRNQVKSQPEAIALSQGDTTYTYSQLDQDSEHLAVYLQSNFQVGPEVMVGLQIPRGYDMVLAVLGILKAGGAYVPASPDYPAARLEYLQNDSGWELCLTSKEMADFWAYHAEQSIGPSPLADPNPEQLAYLIYTSGSTGKPKGVMVEHRHVSQLVDSYCSLPEMDRCKVVAATSQITFDLSVVEILVTFCTGGRVALVVEEDLQDPFRMVEVLARQQVELIQLTPSKLLQLQEALQQVPLPSLRVLVVGGEAFPNQLYHALRDRQNLTVYNLYGPSEDPVWSTGMKINQSEALTIGRALAGKQAYITDPMGNLLPTGLVGELWIGGVGVARGYWNRPELTESRFVTASFAEGNRLYRTGDLARWNAAGELEFLGRADFQTKIRGHRVELGEIEHALESLDEINHALVLVKGQQLLAYLATSRTDFTAKILIDALVQILPETLVPDQFMTLPVLPLNFSGKVDRQALQAMNLRPLELGIPYEAPKTKTQKAIAELWQELLRQSSVGLHDDFFLLGGNSLKLVKLQSLVARQFGVSLGISELAQLRTLGELADEIEAIQLVQQGHKADPTPESMESFTL